MKIRLLTIEDVYDFVKKCEKYSAEIIASQGGYSVEGTSLMGMFSLNLLSPINIEVITDNKMLKKLIYKSLEHWKVKERREEYV